MKLEKLVEMLEKEVSSDVKTSSIGIIRLWP